MSKITAVMSFRWRKIIVALIVLWALMDMSVPGVCRADDLDSSTVSPHQLRTSMYGEKAAIFGEDSLPGNNTPEPLSAEGCFCCCAHSVHTPVFIVPTASAATVLEPAFLLGSPLDQSYSFYNPPKS